MEEEKVRFKKHEYDLERENPIKRYIKRAALTSLCLGAIGLLGFCEYCKHNVKLKTVREYENMQTTIKTLENELDTVRFKGLEDLPYMNAEIKENINKLIEESKKTPLLTDSIRSVKEEMSKLGKTDEFIKDKEKYDKNYKNSKRLVYLSLGLLFASFICGGINELFISPYKKIKERKSN